MESVYKTIKKKDYKNYLKKGIHYNTYKREMIEDLSLNPDLKIKEYINLNQHRMNRVEKTYNVSIDLTKQVHALKHKIYWLVITEHWCGDASQILPVLNAITEVSEGMIEMKLVYRDQNDELMNQYLTNGTKSIPKLIQLDSDFNKTGSWGPRPMVAQKLAKKLKSHPITAITYNDQLHFWYAKDKQQSIEKEIADLLIWADLFCSDCFS